MAKKVTFLVIASLVILFTVNGFARTSDKAFDHGTMVLQTGIGYGPYGIYGDYTIPPISAAFEYGVKFAPKVPISFGAVVAIAGSEEKQFSTYKYKYYMFGGRAAYHFTELINVPKLDLYAGIVLGIDIVSAKFERNIIFPYKIKGVGDSYFLHGVYGGVRYYFVEHVGVFAEVGYGIAYITGGVAFKF